MAFWMTSTLGLHRTGSYAASNNAPPLIKAVTSYRHDQISNLLRDQHCIDERDGRGRAALHFAAQSGFCVSLLLKAAADVNIKDNEGNSPLQLAASEGRCRIIRDFCQAGCDPNVENKSKETPILTLFSKGHVGCISLLVKQGARLDWVQAINRSLNSHKFSTVLYLCKLVGDRKILDGSDITKYFDPMNNPDQYNFWRIDWEECYRFLRHFGYIPNVETRDEGGNRVLSEGPSPLSLRQICSISIRSRLTSPILPDMYQELPLPNKLISFVAAEDYTVFLSGAEPNIYERKDLNRFSIC